MGICGCLRCLGGNGNVEFGTLILATDNLLRVENVFLYVNQIVMDKKLTLSLNATVIDRAKSYASEQGTSLSKMIENYLSLVTRKEEDDLELTPLVKELSGIIQLPDNFDFRMEYTDYLIEKYK